MSAKSRTEKTTECGKAIHTMLQTIKISMLGGFSLTADDHGVIVDAGKLTKPWQLLCYLAVNHDRIVPAEELMTALWDDDELADPANVLKNAVYAVRREIAGKAKPGDGPILYRAGGYCLNPALHFVIDTQVLDALCAAADALAPDAPGRTDTYHKAVAAYTGDFLPMADTEVWIAPYVRCYKLRYAAAARSLCACLEAAEAWDEMLTVSTRASLCVPLDEECLLYSLRAMEKLQMPRAIVAAYSKSARFFEEEVGQTLGPEIRRLYAAAAERVNKTEQDLMVIREDLLDASPDARPLKGAYYCSYDVFKRMYSLVQRTADRGKQKLVLLLITLQDGKRHLPSSQLLLETMTELRIAVQVCLRRSDTFARYSKNQYIVLLPVEDPDNIEAIEQRIVASFTSAVPETKLTLSMRSMPLETR